MKFSSISSPVTYYLESKNADGKIRQKNLDQNAKVTNISVDDF